MPFLRQDYPQAVAPWACPNSGFNLRMEALLVILCKVMTVSRVAQLPGVSDGRVWRTLDHYVDQAHAQEDFSTVPRAVSTRPTHGADTMTSAYFTTSTPSVCSTPAKGEKPGS